MSFNYFFRALRISAVALVFVSGSLWLAPQVALASSNYTAPQTDYAVWIAALFALAVRGIMGNLMAVGVAMFKVKKTKYEQNSKTEKKHHNHGQSPHSLGWIRVMGTGWNKITNDDAGRFCEDGRNEPLGAKLSKKLSESPKLPFLFLLFFRDKRYACTQKYYAEESYPYPQKEREIFEKITRKGDCHDRFTKVGNHFSNEFPAFVADNDHRLNNNMLAMGCQEQCLNGART